jgi:predicted lipid-binding transport protein (Tim44 family)
MDMKKLIVMALTAGLLAGCTTEAQREAQEDRQTFLACKQANPTTWGDKCNAEMNMYYTSSSAAQADSAHRAQTANAIASGLLAGAVAVAAGAAAAEASRPVYVQQVYVQPVVVCRWHCW